MVDGDCEGNELGTPEGPALGVLEGSAEDSLDGTSLGDLEGSRLGAWSSPGVKWLDVDSSSKMHNDGLSAGVFLANH